MDELVPGVYRWTAPHPEWRTRIEWGHEVAGYALVGTAGLSLVDALLPPEGSAARGEVETRLDELTAAASRLDILVTIPYHARCAEALYVRFRYRLPVALWGHPAVARRFTDPATPLTPIVAGERAGSAVPYAIGNPRRYETPLYFPEQRALAFGDALVCVDGAVRIWQPSPFSPAWYNEKLLPSLTPLLELDVEMILATHGAAVLSGGGAALRNALAAPPWDVRD